MSNAAIFMLALRWGFLFFLPLLVWIDAIRLQQRGADSRSWLWGIVYLINLVLYVSPSWICYQGVCSYKGTLAYIDWLLYALIAIEVVVYVVTKKTLRVSGNISSEVQPRPTKKTLIIRSTIFILSCLIVGFIVYRSSVRPATVENISQYESRAITWQREGSDSSLTISDLAKRYHHLVTPLYFLYVLPILPILFTLLFTRRKSIWVTTGAIVLVSIMWIIFWEIFFRIDHVLVIQSGPEDTYASHSIFLAGFSILLLPPAVLAALITGILVSRKRHAVATREI